MDGVALCPITMVHHGIVPLQALTVELANQTPESHSPYSPESVLPVMHDALSLNENLLVLTATKNK